MQARALGHPLLPSKAFSLLFRARDVLGWLLLAGAQPEPCPCPAPGGSRGSQNDTWSTTQAWRFCPKDGAWTPIASMLRARTNHTSAVLNGEIYVIGGKALPGGGRVGWWRGPGGLQCPTAPQGPRWRWWRWSATTPTTRAGAPSARPSSTSATSLPPAAWASSTSWAPALSSTMRSPCSATTPCEVSSHPKGTGASDQMGSTWCQPAWLLRALSNAPVKSRGAGGVFFFWGVHSPSTLPAAPCRSVERDHIPLHPQVPVGPALCHPAWAHLPHRGQHQEGPRL